MSDILHATGTQNYPLAWLNGKYISGIISISTDVYRDVSFLLSRNFIHHLKITIHGSFASFYRYAMSVQWNTTSMNRHDENIQQWHRQLCESRILNFIKKGVQSYCRIITVICFNFNVFSFVLVTRAVQCSFYLMYYYSSISTFITLICRFVLFPPVPDILFLYVALTFAPFTPLCFS